MKLTTSIKRLLKRKFVTCLLVTGCLAAFATTGDGGGRKGQSIRERFNSRNFSLRSHYNYKGNDLLNSFGESKFITVNTVITYKKGNSTYILPLKKRVILDKIKFNPAQVKF